MRIKKFLKTSVLALACIFACTAIIPATSTYAETELYNICEDGTVPPSVRIAQGCEGEKNSDLGSVIVGILDAIIGAAGVVAVIFIIIGGINYMTSAGDSNKVEKGKKTIIYATIGLIICALAFTIVNWVISGVLKQGPQPEETTEKTQTSVTYQLPIA